MAPRMLVCFLLSVLLVPSVGNAQVGQTPPPLVTAATADWQILGEPIFHAGSFYYPAGPTVYFDGNTMVRTGMYNGVPLYTDTTVEPYGLVLVPIGGNVMRPYERRREGELAGSFGSRMPAYPIQRMGDLSIATDARPELARAPVEPFVIPEAASRMGAAGTAVPTTSGSASSPVGTAGPDPGYTVVESIPPPTTNSGVWIDYDGVRYYLAGAAATFSPERFVPIGTYRGFPVYRERGTEDASTIFVSVMPNGPLAPYERR